MDASANDQASAPPLQVDSLPLLVPPISAERALEAAGFIGGYDGSDTASDDSDSGTIDASDIQGIAPLSHEGHYSDPKHLQILEEGGCLFTFTCRHQMTPYEADMVDGVVNLSAFDDEEFDNFVPHFDVRDYKEGPYTFMLARCAYLLPGVDVNRLADPSLLSSHEYQRSCQPGGTKVWTDYDNMEPNNFRITKPIIPYLYSFTIQFRVSALSHSDLSKLGRHVGVRVDRGILLERTKRSKPPKEDGTKKAKSVLLYTDLGRGVVLVTHLTVLLQRGLPGIVERVIDTFGSWGLTETCETAWRTRKHLRSVMPASLEEGEVGSSILKEAYLTAQSSLDAMSTALSSIAEEEKALNRSSDDIRNEGGSENAIPCGVSM